ncbi:MAG: 50S ribosomal protein L5 [Phycisphaerales bacterium]|jgi:large subunit ribosomal protein L5|nr:MAG: 50S ribosomal protein L5 [Phycisphaerales bacterium]
MARLLELYRSEIVPALQESLGVRNRMAVPRLEKIVVSMGVGEASREKTKMDEAVESLAKITGQKPQLRRAKKSVSNFKLRAGMPVGCRVTLRGQRMYEFVERLINAAVPRLRDFRGLNPRSFDGHGNYSMGIADESIFPEAGQGVIGQSQGMNITFITTAKNDTQGRELLTRMGMPFRRTE